MQQEIINKCLRLVSVRQCWSRVHHLQLDDARSLAVQYGVTVNNYLRFQLSAIVLIISGNGFEFLAALPRSKYLGWLMIAITPAENHQSKTDKSGNLKHLEDIRAPVIVNQGP